MTRTLPARSRIFTPVALVSILVHVAAFMAIIVDWTTWRWALFAVVANHLVISTGVLLPRSSLLGPNLTRLPFPIAATGAVSLTFDDGPDPAVTPRVLDLLDQFGAKASFFCLGSNVERYPELAMSIVERGHSVENHSHRHPTAFSFFGPQRLGQEVDRAQAAILAATGSPAHFFRAPAGFRSPFLHAVLARRGLFYASWRRRGFDAVARDRDRVLARLTRHLAAGDILLLHDRQYQNSCDGVPMVLAVLPQLLNALADKDLHSISLPAAFLPAISARG